MCGCGVSARQPFVRDVQKAVAKHYGVPVATMTEPRPAKRDSSNVHTIAHPRQVAMALSFLITSQSKKNIGRLFGGRDHTTVLHAVRAVNKREHDRKVMRRLTLELVRR
jgi:chromosomal replication initiator protein